MTLPLLLDTHVWVWLMLGDERLSNARRKTIERAAVRDAVRVSIISVWEIAMLAAKGRLILDCDCANWVQAALAAPGLSLAELTPAIAVASAALPGRLHADPADRIIIATARVTDAVLVTADQAIIQYGRNGHVKIARAD